MSRYNYIDFDKVFSILLGGLERAGLGTYKRQEYADIEPDDLYGCLYGTSSTVVTDYRHREKTHFTIQEVDPKDESIVLYDYGIISQRSIKWFMYQVKMHKIDNLLNEKHDAKAYIKAMEDLEAIWNEARVLLGETEL